MAGSIVRTEGDAIFAAFGEAGAAVAAAADAQRALRRSGGPADVDVRVRMGLHSGEAHLAGDDYGGFDVNRAARVAAAGARRPGPPVGADGGPRRGPAARRRTRCWTSASIDSETCPGPSGIAQLCIAGLPDAFPPLRTGGPVRGDLPDRLTTFLGRDAGAGRDPRSCSSTLA